jgi:peptidoglycan/LPS O-acetylase OafA/YrhL
MVAERRSRLILLDGLRGIAAILVVLYHCNTIRQDKIIFFDAGFLAVDFYFILSGFVLTLAFEQRFGRGLGTVGFMKLRVIRLWPALTVGVLLGAVAITLDTPSPLIVPLILLSLLMVPFLTPGGLLFSVNCVQWSLAFELIANLTHVLVLRRLSQRTLIAICAACGTAMVVAIDAFGTVGMGAELDTVLYGFPRVGFSYTLGILLARRWHGEPASVTPGWVFVLAGPVALIVGASLLPAPLRPVGEGIAMLVAMPLLFHAASRAKAPSFAEPWLHWLGSLSYPLYAVHYPLLWIAAWINVRLYPDTPKFLWTLLGLIAALLLAQAMASAGHWVTQRKKPRAAPLPA